MKRQVTPLALGLCLLGLVSAPVFADTDTAELKQLKHELSALQHKVAKLENKSQNRNVYSETASKKHTPISGPSNLPTSGTQYLPVDIDVPGQSFVSSGPYIGIPLEFSGGNLIINSPSINEDVTLLKLRKNIRERLSALGRPEEADHSHILLSGIAEVQASYSKTESSPSTSDLNLTSAILDAYILGPSTWTSALLEFAYDSSSGTASGSFGSNKREFNSRVYISKAFIVLGDMMKTPFYSTIGQLYVPFGQYSSAMISDPLTKLLARTKARTLVVGYDDTTYYGAVYGFKGASHASATSRVNNGGLNLGYRYTSGGVHANLGGGVIANIADSNGMQDTGGTPGFDGFGGPSATIGGTPVTVVNTGNETLVHRVAAYDLRAQVAVGERWDFLGEYIFAASKFNPADLTLNGHGARPKALNAEAAYTMPWFSRPTSISVGYGMTKDALALGLPAQRYSLTLNTSFWKDTLESLEFRHDIDYGASAVSTGSTVAGPSGTGNSTNAITAQFDIYF